jgi:hypothetical protein
MEVVNAVQSDTPLRALRVLLNAQENSSQFPPAEEMATTYYEVGVSQAIKKISRKSPRNLWPHLRASFYLKKALGSEKPMTLRCSAGITKIKMREIFHTDTEGPPPEIRVFVASSLSKSQSSGYPL